MIKNNQCSQSWRIIDILHIKGKIKGYGELTRNSVAKKENRIRGYKSGKEKIE